VARHIRPRQLQESNLAPSCDDRIKSNTATAAFPILPGSRGFFTTTLTKGTKESTKRIFVLRANDLSGSL
jgi:hypothetical protein